MLMLPRMRGHLDRPQATVFRGHLDRVERLLALYQGLH